MAQDVDSLSSNNNSVVLVEHDNEQQHSDHQDKQEQHQLISAKEFGWSKAGFCAVDNQKCLNDLVKNNAVGKCLLTAVTVLAGKDCPKSSTANGKGSLVCCFVQARTRSHNRKGQVRTFLYHCITAATSP
ncbi:hypothetical protein ACA910_008843 [Epithemia clementina (nom. ined.)]